MVRIKYIRYFLSFFYVHVYTYTSSSLIRANARIRSFVWVPGSGRRPLVREKLGKSRQWENPVLGAGGDASYVG